jgi:hypothetical protein
MSKINYPPPQIAPIQANATTASPSLVRAITLDPIYEVKTADVVLTRDEPRPLLPVGQQAAEVSPPARRLLPGYSIESL